VAVGGVHYHIAIKDYEIPLHHEPHWWFIVGRRRLWAHRIIVKKVVYDEFMKKIRTVRHSFNTTGTANYRVQLAVPPSTNNNRNHNNIVLLKSVKLGIFN